MSVHTRETLLTSLVSPSFKLLSCRDRRLLRSKNEEGTYLIREGSAKSGSHKVLTVWHDEHCRHYKLFKHEVSVSSEVHYNIDVH